MASNNQKCVWVYAITYEIATLTQTPLSRSSTAASLHYFQTEEEADVWWASHKVGVGAAVSNDGHRVEVGREDWEAREQVWMFQKPQATTLERPIGGWGECQKAWSGSCGCDVCADQEEQNECEICGATPEIADDWDGNSVCDECFMCCEECYNTKNPAVFEKTASDLCECEKEDSDEVKHYKAVLAETLRYEAIMDMMKK